MLKVLQSTVLLLIGAALVVVIQIGSGLSFANMTFSSAEFISIILTALGVILAALALFIGVLAVIGWATFESKIKSTSEEFLERRFSTDDLRYGELIAEIKEDVRRQIATTQRHELPENESPYSEDAI